jgi:hypothetical protein
VSSRTSGGQCLQRGRIYCPFLAIAGKNPCDGHGGASTITERIAACRDPMVSGDSDLLALTAFRDIPIVTPATFVQGAAR